LAWEEGEKEASGLRGGKGEKKLYVTWGGGGTTNTKLLLGEKKKASANI